MPKGKTHRTIAALTVGSAFMCQDSLEDSPPIKPLLGATLAGMLGSLPDWLEPSLNNPHHRQFFHSLAFGTAVGFAGYKALKWKPENALGEVTRFALLVGCGAYMSYLVADAFSPRSLPLLGKI